MTIQRQWHRIDFPYWSRGGNEMVELTVNEFSATPIVLEIINGDDRASEWMSADDARELAKQLNAAADAVEKAGMV